MTQEEHLRLTLLTNREIEKLSAGMGKTLTEVGTSFNEDSKPVEIKIVITSSEHRENVKRRIINKEEIWAEVFVP